MSLTQFGPTAWLCRALETSIRVSIPRYRRSSPAARLQKVLRPQEKHLTDLYGNRNLGTALRAALQEQDVGYSGLWRKDKDKSDSMEKAFESIQLPWLYRRAVGFLNNLVVEDTEEYFRTTLKAGGVMDVVEQYPWTGEEVIHKRRDKRKGTHRGKVQRTSEGPQLTLQWDDPYGGRGIDTFTLTNDGRTLVHKTSILFDDDSKNCTYSIVYNRTKQDA